MSHNRIGLVATIAITLSVHAAAWAQSKGAEHPMTPGTATLPLEGDFPSLAGATTWLNSPPLTPKALRGKVVLVDFWTYTCINWLRTAPYIRAWADRYKAQGLVVVGVHAPEFAFEHNLDNVRRMIGVLGVTYPVLVDNDQAIWRAFANNYWPALYFIDAQGRIRHHQFGEGNYVEAERIIQQLLAEAGRTDSGHALTPVDPTGQELAADWDNLKSQENYLGADRTENFDAPGGMLADKRQVYPAAPRLTLNHWALVGDWTPRAQSVDLNQAGGRIVYRFHGRDVNLVMGPALAVRAVRFRVTIDGKPPGAAHGVDTDSQGLGTVTVQRMYQLIRQPGPIGDRTFEIEFLDPGVEAFAFTFG